MYGEITLKTSANSICNRAILFTLMRIKEFIPTLCIYCDIQKHLFTTTCICCFLNLFFSSAIKICCVNVCVFQPHSPFK